LEMTSEQWAHFQLYFLQLPYSLQYPWNGTYKNKPVAFPFAL
jgi:hypothetical protein